MKETVSNKLCLFYTTFPSEEEAKKVITVLLEDKFLACANFFPITSLYVWEGKLENGSEVGCFLKTLEDKKILFRQKFLENHPYEVPCLMEIEVKDVHEPYLNWARTIVSSA